MEVELRGGAKIDLFNRQEFREELRDGLRDWLAEIRRGVRFVRASLYGAADGTGVLILGETGPNQIGPAGSMLWAITRISVSGLTGAQAVQFHLNDRGSPSHIGTVTAPTDAIIYGSTGLVLNPLDKLLAGGSGLTANGFYAVNVQAVELPVQLAWQLI